MGYCTVYGIRTMVRGHPIDQRKVDVSTGISNVSCKKICVSVCVCVCVCACSDWLMLWVCRGSVLRLCARALFRPTPPVYVYMYCCTVHLPRLYTYTYTTVQYSCTVTPRLIVDTPHNFSLIVARRSPRHCSNLCVPLWIPVAKSVKGSKPTPYHS